MVFVNIEQDVVQEIERLPEKSFSEYRDKLIEDLESYSNLAHYFTTNKAITHLHSLINQFPSEKLKQNMGEQILDDFKIYPIWEAGKLAVDSYVPWPDVDYITHEQSVWMSRLLLRIAFCALFWLKEKDPEYGQFQV